MKAIKRLIVLVLAGLAITACSNGNEAPEPQTENPDTDVPDVYAAFSIRIPSASRSRSVQGKATDSGIDAENIVKTLHVFIYDYETPHTPTVAQFSVDDNSLKPAQNSSTQWITDKAIKTKKTDKLIFAGINLTSAIVTEILNSGLGAFNYQEFAQTVSDLADTTKGFVMFNAAYPVKTVAGNLSGTEEAAQNSPIAISVDRAVAKAAVSKGGSFVVNGGGQMSELKYGWRNINKKFYFIPKLDGGIIKDYNWDTYSTNDFYRGTDVLPVNENGVTPSRFSYALENAFNFVPNVSVVNGATFLSVQGKFVPDKAIRIKESISSTGGTPSKRDDFETIDNPGGAATFYVVRTNDGIANYFIDPGSATEFARLSIANAPGMPVMSGTYDILKNTYTDGLCYYHIFVNSGTATPYAPYNIYRNQYYKVTINSIQAPGNPNDNFDDGEPIVPNAWIDVDINVNAWVVVEEDQDL